MPPAAALVEGNLAAVATRTPNRTAVGRGPRAALRNALLSEMCLDAKLDWVEQARLDAILGACRLSMESWRSGVRCYVAYIGACCCNVVGLGLLVNHVRMCRCSVGWAASLLPSRA